MGSSGPLQGPGGGPGGEAPGNFGVYAILGVGERGFSDDFLKQKS